MLKGIAASSGVAIGKAYKLEQPQIVMKEEKGTVEDELAIFDKAIQKTIADIEMSKRELKAIFLKMNWLSLMLIS